MHYHFGACELDLVRGCLRLSGAEVSLRPKSFETLRYLVENRGRLLPKDELIKAIWPTTTVSDESLATCIADVRRAIGDRDQVLIKTVQRRGYVFTPEVVTGGPLDGSPGSGAGVLDDTASDKPSIAVLAFDNMSGDPSQEYFSDGITEDIITELSRFSELLVIARNSSFRYKGQRIDVRQVSKELRARYVLEGSVRRAGDRIRISAQLIDAATGTHRWAEHYDRELEDVFAVQDEVARAIVTILAVHLQRAEAERALLKPPTTWQAHDCYLLGVVTHARYRSSFDAAVLYEARDLLERSISIDPTYARPHALLAGTHLSAYLNAVDGDYRNPPALERAYELARKAVHLDPNLPLGHAMFANVLAFKQRYQESVAEFERALALNPNFSSFEHLVSVIMAGEHHRAIEVAKAHRRLDPFYEPLTPFMLGMAYYMLRDHAEAIGPLREVVLRAPDFMQGHLWLAATCAQLGLLDEARAEAAHALSISPSYTIPTTAPFNLRADADHFLDGLRKAGLPEKPS